MSLVEALVLGLVQGVTEFLPISSTAHLRVVPAALGWPDPGAALTAVLQLGSLAAVIGFFVGDLWGMARAALDPARRRGPEARQLLYLVVGTLPIGIAGLAFKDAIEGPLRGLPVIATALVAMGVMLGVADRRGRQRREVPDVTLRDALLVGLAQALALIPGVSRSGVTLTAALLLGFKRDAAARFSFLLSVPAVAAAGVFELPDVLGARDIGVVPLAGGLLAAAISGYASIAWLLRFLRTRSALPFVFYRVALGLALAAAWAAGWREG
jgi:undecaprenyl-diphosphatase